jgi:hypothetical protein
VVCVLGKGRKEEKIKSNILAWNFVQDPTKIVLGLYGKNLFKNAREVEFQFYAQKTAKNTPSWTA